MYIGILEDEETQRDLYRMWFDTAQIRHLCFDNADDFVNALSRESFDLLLIDWILPRSSGEAVLRWVRANIGWEIPVIFVTSRDGEKDIVAALRAGADDYLVKPPKYLELLARMESLTRRSRPPSVIDFGSYRINRDSRNIELDGAAVKLTQKEYELACYLFENPGKLMSRVHLLEHLWGLNANVDTRTVDTHVSRIRRKLQIKAAHGWQIVPEYGYGYRMEKLAGSQPSI